jgi:Fe-S-cluster containining protein
LYQTDLNIIAQEAEVREDENYSFRSWLKTKDSKRLDGLVHGINDRVSAAIDCTQCGNCCNKLVINVTKTEMRSCSKYLNVSETEFKEKYLEESQQGELYINTIPCHFFAEKKCTIYENRFKECREFPHLHKPGFQQRLLGTLMHYGTCPIVYNVLEELKDEMNYRY